ncbi:MAG: protein kinase [Gemmataceae bacterium]
MSKPNQGSMEPKSVSDSKEATIAPDALPPMPEAVKPQPPAPQLPQPDLVPVSAVKTNFTFLGPAQASDEVGRLGTKFRILRLLGKGGMGMVFLAEDTVLHRQVAIKVMLPELAADQEAADRFLREAKAIARVKHERIVSLYDMDTFNGVPYLVMELLEGLSLQDILRQKRRLSLPQIARIGRDIAGGLAAAHRWGIIHRDIKPGNIWLEAPSGQVKILDFGLARIQTPDQITSVSGGLRGTPAYMSPEQALGRPLDARSDLFSLGTVLYQLCTGHLPFVANTLFELLEAIARLPHKPVLNWNPETPQPFAALIHQLLAKEPEYRPQSALVVAERLDDILQYWPPTAQNVSVSRMAPPPLPDMATPVDGVGDTNALEPRQNTPPVHALPVDDRTERAVTPTPYPLVDDQPPVRPRPLPDFTPAGPTPGPPPLPPPIPSPTTSWSRRPPVRVGGPLGLPKPVWFALMGALGCLLAALIFEAPLRLLLPASSSTSGMIGRSVLKADVVFVLDTTATMDPHVADVSDMADRFLTNLKREEIDAQIGLVYFRFPPEDPKELTFDGKPFTSNPAVFRREVAELRGEGELRVGHSSLDGMDYASTLPFRPGSAKVLVLITDEGPTIPDKKNADEKALAETLKKAGIQQLHLFVKNNPLRYIALQQLLGKDGKAAGEMFALDNLRAETGLEEKIARLARTQIRVRALCAEEEFRALESGRLVVAMGAWTAAIAQGLVLALLCAAMVYLGQSLRRIVSFVNASVSIVLTFAAGALAQGLTILLTIGVASGTPAVLLDLLAKLLGWMLVGLAAGLVLGFFMPNVSKLKGLLAGLVAGLFAGLLYVVLSALFGSMLGRWLGALFLGLGAGLLVAFLESAFRRWWLEIRRPSGEVRTLALGADLVSVGSDPGRATIVLPEGPPIAFRFYLDGDKVMCEDRGGSFEIFAGDQQEINGVSIMLCNPESVGRVGFALALSNGRTIPLSEGLPLTAEDLPGLHTSYPDGMVALVSPKTAEPDLLLLSNRSQQQWKMTDARGAMRIIDPGVGVTLASGTRIDFGRIEGQLVEMRAGEEASVDATV